MWSQHDDFVFHENKIAFHHKDKFEVKVPSTTSEKAVLDVKIKCGPIKAANLNKQHKVKFEVNVPSTTSEKQRLGDDKWEEELKDAKSVVGFVQRCKEDVSQLFAIISR